MRGCKRGGGYGWYGERDCVCVCCCLCAKCCLAAVACALRLGWATGVAAAGDMEAAETAVKAAYKQGEPKVSSVWWW
jgi:hypothetical protein